MTRLRADAIDTPLPMIADFCGQRASDGGFLIAESAAISIPVALTSALRASISRNTLLVGKL
jgi:hypothetical protein